MLDAGLRKSLMSVSTSELADARVRLGLPEGHLDPGIRPLVPFSTMVGTAVTVRLEVARDAESADMTLMNQTTQTEWPGAIFVIQVPEELHSHGTFGRGAATRARRSKMVGALVEGALRDSVDLREMEFPVFSRSIGPGYLLGKASVAAVGEPVNVGGRLISAGDVIVADNDGVMVISPGDAEAVAERALAIREWEGPRHRMIADGLSYPDVARLSGPMP